jgi:hypothetical protein
LLVGLLFGVTACHVRQSAAVGPSDVPVLGAMYGQVLDELGAPEKSMGNLKLYAQKGLIFYTNPKEEQVIGLVCSWFEGGFGFRGQVYGFRLGDTYPKALKTWGTPERRYYKNELADEVYWKNDSMEVWMEIGRESGFDATLTGDYEAETIKRMVFCWGRPTCLPQLP